MSGYSNLQRSELEALKLQLEDQYNEYKSKGLNLVMSRGVPCPEQLSLSDEMLTIKEAKTPGGVDCRNYGGVDGIAEAKELFAELMEVKPSQVIIGGNSSLNLMYDTIARHMLVGVPGINKPWSKLNKVRFLCPSPGYDRHFSICELFGIDMIIVPMLSTGPDMDFIESQVAKDSSIKGIWCVPKYSNPDGITYSDETVRRLAKLKTTADDFTIMWDNAYAVHHLSDQPDQLLNIFNEAAKADTENRVFQFVSTSKITYAGAGVSALITSASNCSIISKQINIATIGPDKINQLRHVLFFKNAEGIQNHMKKHAAILAPKFDMVCDVLQKELGGLDIAWWIKPNGGYFINLRTLDHCADKIVKMAAAAGVTLTAPAGSAFPYKKDPDDRNIRLAPSYPSLVELETAIKLVAICVKLVSVEKELH